MTSPMSPPSATAINQQLERILSSPRFSRSKRMSALLRYLVTEELSGNGERLKGYTVGVEALGKPVDFDPGTDAAVRVETGRLRRMLAEYYESFPVETDPVAFSVPKGNYRPQFSNRRIDESARDFVAPKAGPCIALVEFESVGQQDSESARYLFDEVSQELFRYREFEVVDVKRNNPHVTTTLEAYCKDDLDCEFMVSARLQHDEGLALHVAVSDLDLGRLIWVRRLTAASKALADLRALAIELVVYLAKPAGVLPLAAIHKRYGASPERWSPADCVLRWHYYRLRDRSPQSHAILLAQVRRVVEEDPLFSWGYLIEAMLTLDEVIYRLNSSRADADALKRASYLIEQIVAGEGESNALVHYVKAQTHYFLREMDDFERSLEQAVSMHPNNPDLLHHSGAFSCFAGHTQRGLEWIERANMRSHAGIGYRLAYLVLDFLDVADYGNVRLFESTYLPPNFSVGHVVGALLYAKHGQLDQAVYHLNCAGELEARIDRNLRELVLLWFADTGMAQVIIDQISLIERHRGRIVALQRTL